MKISYSVNGERFGPIEAWPSLGPYDWSSLAECAAEDFHYRRDGWEANLWPKDFTLHLSSDVVVEVDREVVPQFSALRIRVQSPGAIAADEGDRGRKTDVLTTPAPEKPAAKLREERS